MYSSTILIILSSSVQCDLSRTSLFKLGIQGCRHLFSVNLNAVVMRCLVHSTTSTRWLLPKRTAHRCDNLTLTKLTKRNANEKQKASIDLALTFTQ